jgi:mannose/fructose/N-acetylgalactosamine-specific phosphotransferase system component IID
VGKIMTLGENVRKTIKMGHSNRISANLKHMTVVGFAASVKPLFHKKYYKKKIKFTIEFALN